MSGGVRNVFMEDCRIVNGSMAVYIKANLDRGGVVENVRVRRIDADRIRHAVVRFETSYHGYQGGNHPPVFRDFEIEDVTCDVSDGYAVYAEGVTGSPIQNVTLRNIAVRDVKRATWLRHFEQFHFENVQVDGVDLPQTPPPTADDEAKLKVGL